VVALGGEGGGGGGEGEEEDGEGCLGEHSAVLERG